MTLPFATGGLFVSIESRATNPQPEAAADGRVRGVVTDGDSGARLSGATVRMKGRGSPSSPRTITGPDGAWLIEGLSADSYRLRVTAPGYRRVRVDVDVPPGHVVVEVPVSLTPQP